MWRPKTSNCVAAAARSPPDEHLAPAREEPRANRVKGVGDRRPGQARADDGPPGACARREARPWPGPGARAGCRGGRGTARGESAPQGLARCLERCRSSRSARLRAGTTVSRLSLTVSVCASSQDVARSFSIARLRWRIGAPRPSSAQSPRDCRRGRRRSTSRTSATAGAGARRDSGARGPAPCPPGAAASSRRAWCRNTRARCAPRPSPRGARSGCGR